MSISADDFRSGMRQLAAAVNVITTVNAGQRAGMTATAVMSVTADPPQLAIAVNRSNASFEAISASQIFAINVLPHGHADLANRFAGGAKGEDRFATATWGKFTTGAPVLLDSAAIFDCHLVQTIEFSSHVLFIEQVAGIKVTPNSTPLLYMDGTWASLVRANETDFAAYEDVILQVEASIDEALASPLKPSAQLSQFSHAFACVSVDGIDALRSFFARETFVPAARLENINRRKRNVESKLQVLLTRGVETGEFALADAGATAVAIIGMLNSVHRRMDLSAGEQRDSVGRHFSELIASMVTRRSS